MPTRRRWITRSGLLAVAGAVATAAPARAQWSATVLNPAGAYTSEIWALAPGQQGGLVQPSTLEDRHAAVWGGGASWTDLGLTGRILAMTDDQQGGAFGGRACIWSGTPESRVSLHPSNPGITGSVVLSTTGAQQSGYAFQNGEYHAALWSGTAASYVSLHPAGALNSFAYGTDGSRQWGYATFSTAQGVRGYAGYWNGTADSFVSLNPGPDTQTIIQGIGGGQQAGYIIQNAMPPTHAAICSGTASSWVDLHPFPGLGASELYATTGAVQVGWSNVHTASSPHAGVWFGTASSFIDLTQFLPAGFGGESIATCVMQDQGRIYVGGFADGPNGQHQAVLWTYVPSSGAATLLPLAFVAAFRRKRPATK